MGGESVSILSSLVGLSSSDWVSSNKVPGLWRKILLLLVGHPRKREYHPPPPQKPTSKM
jgi:hypothetical protein